MSLQVWLAFIVAAILISLSPGAGAISCMATLSVVDIIVMSGYALFASRVPRLLRQPRQLRWMNRGFGALFVFAAGFLALFRRA